MLVIARADRAVLVHCAAGTDRPGVAVALALDAAGLSALGPEGEMRLRLPEAAVHRTTVHRRCPTLVGLIVEALVDAAAEIRMPDTGNIRGELEGPLRYATPSHP